MSIDPKKYVVGPGSTIDDTDLDETPVRLPSGRVLNEADAERYAEEAIAKSGRGRPSLAGGEVSAGAGSVTEPAGEPTSSMQLVVGGIIVDDLNAPARVLSARRTSPPELRGRWEFPGGKVEAGESPEAALVRELNEELGVHVVLGKELVDPLGPTWPISGRLELRLWFAIISDGIPKADGSHDELRWLDRESLTSVDWLDADKQVLDSVFRRDVRPPA